MSQATARESHARPAPLHGLGRRTAVALGILIAVIALAVGVALGYSLARSEARDATAEADRAREDLERLAGAHATLQERNWILYLEVEERRLAEGEGIKADPAQARPGVFTEGTYAVGSDILPGTYRGEVNGEFGYWARLSSTTGMVSGIVANDVVRGPFVLTIIASDAAVELRGVTLTVGE